MLAKLIPAKGEGDDIVLTEDVTLVGRKPGLCDLVLDHGSISKIQCLIIKTDGLLFIRDLGSTNGTKVNGQRITRGALLPGDELAFASVKFTIFLGPDLPVQREEQEYGLDAKTEAISSFAEYSIDAAEHSELQESASDSDVRLLSHDELDDA